MTDSAEEPRSLPDRPNLRHLKDQAKNLLKTGGVKSLAEAQFQIARLYGFASWPKLKAHVDLLEETGQLKQAIDTNNLDTVKTLMTRNPTLHRAPLGYAKNGPLTWVAECRVPWGPPSPVRLAMAEWMIDHGSDVHQGGDGPLMRATLGDRIPMMELLVRRLNRRGVVNAKVTRKWISDPHRPRVMRSCLQRQRRSVDRGTCGPGIQPRKNLAPGRRRCKEKRKAPSGAPISRGVPESRAVRDLVHVRRHHAREPGDPKSAQGCSCLGTHREV